MSVFFVYDHAEELGGVRIGARHIRFEPDAVAAFVNKRRVVTRGSGPKSAPTLDFIFRRR